MSYEELDILRRRAEAFLEMLKDCWKREADLAMFSMEQYCQLILKYKLLLLRGFYPKAHSLRRLIRTLGEVPPEVLTLVNDVKNLHYIAKLEEAYISSRYAPIEYEVEEAKDVYKFIEEVFKPLVEPI
ncbi:HEPN domain-containing protein [Thermofilum sp.]|uniref:HEPN domain-containing protein n=1 Tax=Thermofilum sp. TaxID=1961369 RepID=UPI0031604640